MLCQVRLTPSGSPSGALLYRYSGRRNIISCATVATSSPERLKIEPCASILPPCALGESSTYSSHSSRAPAVEPHRVIQRGALEARFQPELAVTTQSRLQRQVIRSVGDSGAVLRLRRLRTISMHQAVKGLEPHAGTRLCRGGIRLSVQGASTCAYQSDVPTLPPVQWGGGAGPDNR